MDYSMSKNGQNTDNINHLANNEDSNVVKETNRENDISILNEYKLNEYDWKKGICKECGEPFEKRTTWQVFCCKQHKLDFYGVTNEEQLYKKAKGGKK